MVAIILPTRNEAAIIRVNLERLLAFLRNEDNSTLSHDRGNGWDWNSDESWRVVVADNGSTDATAAIVREVAAREPRVELIEISKPGKGRAVMHAWRHVRTCADGLKLTPDAFMFMDADLATDLNALPKLIAAIRDGADIAVGSRCLPGSRTERGLLRWFTSWCYRLALRLLFGLRVSDPPCGFKAVSERVVHDVVPKICDTQWFFDTELLLRTQRAGMRIAEVPVTWREPRCGHAFGKVLRIITSDLRAMWRLLCERQS